MSRFFAIIGLSDEMLLKLRLLTKWTWLHKREWVFGIVGKVFRPALPAFRCCAMRFPILRDTYSFPAGGTFSSDPSASLCRRPHACRESRSCSDFARTRLRSSVNVTNYEHASALNAGVVQTILQSGLHSKLSIRKYLYQKVLRIIRRCDIVLKHS